MNDQPHTCRYPKGTQGIRSLRDNRGIREIRGITLVEMMVALAITSLVILVVNQLFNSVITTVARGTQAGELLQKSRTLDEQLAFESELVVSGDPNVIASWQSRMVGPAGRDNTPTTPGGFLAIVQRVVPAPLTIEDGIRSVTRFIRSDQLMFIYDQETDGGTRRLPTMAPASPWSFTGDQRDSENAEYVRMWYGHVIQTREDQDPTQINMNLATDYQDIDLGATNSGNPNVLAQDWVLGRHALFLTDIALDTAIPPITEPYGPYTNNPMAVFNVIGVPNSPRLGNGVSDVANLSLDDLTGLGAGPLATAPNQLAYQGLTLSMMFTQNPLLTSAKPVGTSGDMKTWDVSPTHTYFMGGVSDFIVEFAGDLVNDTFFMIGDPTQITPDGELDRDPDGRIKWYTALNPNFKTAVNSPPAISQDLPITYPIPNFTQYTPHMNPALLGGFRRADAAFVWQHEGSPGFTQWPWMIRIRYRLHDRRGEFEGREITNTATGLKELEPGIWYETIIPVNFQDLP